MKEKISRYTGNWHLYLGLVGTVITCGYLAFHILGNIHRGFDFTDEGFYLLSLQENYNPKYTLSAWHLVFRKVFGFMELNPINVRYIRFGLALVSALVLTSSVWVLIKSHRARQTSIVHFFMLLGMSVLATLMSYCTLPQSPSYNDLSMNLIYISVGLVLASLANWSTLVSFVLALLGGFISFWTVPVKLSIAPILVCVLAFLILGLGYLFNTNNRKKIMLLCALFIGVCFGAGIAWTDNDLRHFLTYIPMSFDLLQGASNGHDSHALLESVREGVRKLLRLGFMATVVYLMFGFFWRLLKNKLSKNYLEPVLGLLLAVVSVLVIVRFLPIGRSNFLLPIAFFSIYSIIAVLYAHRGEKKKFIIFLLGLFVVAAPLMFSFGTNRLLMMAACGFLAFWFLPLVVFSHKLPKFMFIVVLLFMLYSVYDTFNNWHVTAPYRQPVLATQDQEFEFRDTKLLLDKPRADYLEELRGKLLEIDYRQCDYVLGFYKVPGLVYLLEGEALGGLLWDEANLSTYCANLREHKLEQKKNFYIIQNQPPSEELVACLKTKTIDLNKFYIMDSVKTVPELRLTNEWTYIYTGPFIEVKNYWLEGLEDNPEVADTSSAKTP